MFSGRNRCEDLCRRYFGMRNDIAPPSHMPSDRISSRRKLLPSSSMAIASGLTSVVSRDGHGFGLTPLKSKSASILGSFEFDPAHSKRSGGLMTSNLLKYRQF
jgi:hypothetical protein